MREITYNGETHTLEEWVKILQREDDLRQFAEELVFDGRISNDMLYRLYTIWQGENCLPKTSFEKRITSTFKLHRSDLQPYRSGNVRGWKCSDGN